MKFSGSQHSKIFLLIGIVVSMVIWGVAWPSAKVLTQYATPMQIAFLRFIFTSLGVLVILLSLKVPLGIKKEGLVKLVSAATLLALYTILFFTGVKKGTPGAGGVLVTTTTPLVSYIIAMIVQKRKPSHKEFIGLSIGIIGAFFLLKLWSEYDHILQSGNLFFLISTLTWALLSRLTARSGQFGSPLAFTFWMYVVCTLLLSFTVDVKNCIHIAQHASWIFWSNLLFNGVVNAGMATTFFFFATSKLGAERTSSFIYIVPFSAALSSLLFLNEQIMWNTIVGGLLGIAAVYVINSKKLFK